MLTPPSPPRLPAWLEEELPLARLRELLEQARENGQPELSWELGIHLDTLTEAFREYGVRLQALEEEKRQFEERLQREHQGYAQLRASMHELLDLHAFSRTISASFDLQDVLEALLDLSRRLTEYHSCGVFFIGRGEAPLEPVALRGDATRLRARVLAQWEDGIIHWILREGHPVVIEDEEDPAWSFIHIPLRVRGEQLGFFTLYCLKGKGEFTFGELESLDVLTSHAAVAMENARLYTDLERAHLELKESQHQLLLSAKQAAVGELAGGVAHEVNNPLQIILSRVQLMLLQQREPGRLGDDLRLIEHNVKRISRIIRALLGFARNNSQDEGWGLYDLGQAVQQACTLVRHQLSTHLIEVEVECPEDLPRLQGNVGELEQVFLNLILNAQNAMPKGGRLRIGVRRESEVVELRFADTGTGIPPENLDRIFEPFFTTRSSQGGTGLGLAVSHRIITNHGGTLTVESPPGQGATFIIRLPLHPPAETPNDKS
ncbi:MAG: GAF domain-containing protein [Candidatus Latescibacteria bacterium]|nr:GAF domain-containing protein [Candidatus Latescibacterota bacterium]